jgi:hypothetical protein
MVFSGDVEDLVDGEDQHQALQNEQVEGAWKEIRSLRAFSHRLPMGESTIAARLSSFVE